MAPKRIKKPAGIVDLIAPCRPKQTVQGLCEVQCQQAMDSEGLSLLFDFMFKCCAAMRVELDEIREQIYSLNPNSFSQLKKREK